MALLTYEIRGLGDIASDRRDSLRMSMVANDPKLAMAFRQAGEQYVAESQGVLSQAFAPPEAGGLPTWVKWVAGGLGVAALLGIGVAIFRKRAA